VNNQLLKHDTVVSILICVKSVVMVGAESVVGGAYTSYQTTDVLELLRIGMAVFPNKVT